MDAEKICRICLRTDRRLKGIHKKFTEFYSELCVINVDLDALYCYECEHLIKKCYNFKERCLQSIKLLTGSRMKLQDTPVEQLCKLLPPSNVGYNNNSNSFLYTYEHVCTDDISSNAAEHENETETPQEFTVNIDIIKMEHEGSKFDTVVVIQDSLKGEPFEEVINDDPNTDQITIKVEKVNESWIDDNCDSSVYDGTEIVTQLDIKEEADTYEEVKDNYSIDNVYAGSNMIEHSVSVDETLIDFEQHQHKTSAIPKGKNRAAGTATSCNAQTATASKHMSGTNDLVAQFDNGGPSGDRHVVKKNEKACKNINKKLSLKKTLKSIQTKEADEYKHITKCKSIEKTNTKEKQFACDQCYYKSNRRTNLLQHYRIHTKEKPFACNICDYKASIKHHLNEHVRIHTKEKPFACSLCDYRGRQHHHLLGHLRTHTKEKPFACDICNFKSNNKNNLLAHIRSHAEVKSFECDICGHKCKRKQYLVKHIKTHVNTKQRHH